MKVAVVGIGQSLRGDDAIGLESVQAWQQHYGQTAGRPEITVETAELPGLSLLDILSNADAAILVDAVQSGAAVATIHHLDLDQLAAFSETGNTAHGWGLAETLTLARKLNHPVGSMELRIIGIEIVQVNLGDGLSNEIKDAIPIICAAIEEALQDFLV